MKPIIDRRLKMENKKIWTGTYVKVPTEVMQLLDSEYEQRQHMGQVYTCLRGEHIDSMKQLSHACNIPEGSIYRYLKLLEDQSYISLRRLQREVYRL